MALQALKIMTEEIARCRRTLAGRADEAFSAQSVNDRLDSLEARVKNRIEQECIEIPEPDFDILKDDHVHLAQLLEEDDIPF